MIDRRLEFPIVNESNSAPWMVLFSRRRHRQDAIERRTLKGVHVGENYLQRAF
jgi:hypothetical protein